MFVSSCRRCRPRDEGQCCLPFLGPYADVGRGNQAIRRNPGESDVIEAARPFGRIAEPEEVADVVVFLCGSGASYVTGTGLIVDAGLTLTLHVG